MKCPHCQAEEPEGATECPRCGFIFAKWRAATAAAAAPAPAAASAPARRPQEESSPVVLWGGLAAAVLAYVFFFRHPSGGEAAEEAQQALAGPALEAQAAEPVPEGWWRLQGRVMDVTRSRPVGGARIVLKPGGAQAQTGKNGLYQLAGAPLASGAYTLEISHPKYQAPHYSGELDDIQHEYKARGACPSVLDPEELTPRSGELIHRDFGLCPRR